MRASTLMSLAVKSAQFLNIHLNNVDNFTFSNLCKTYRLLKVASYNGIFTVLKYC